MEKKKEKKKKQHAKKTQQNNPQEELREKSNFIPPRLGEKPGSKNGVSFQC